MSGIATNTGATLNATNGAWVLNGGTIIGGNVTTSKGFALVVSGTGTLNGVSFDGSLDM